MKETKLPIIIIIVVLLIMGGSIGTVRSQGKGKIIWLGTLGGLMSQAKSVSADGKVVVGAGQDTSGNWHAFRWESGTMQDLGTLGGRQSGASAVAADGKVVVGATDDANNFSRAFRWENGTMQDLGTPGSNFGKQLIAHSISANGSVVVGEAQDDSTFYDYPFRWENGTWQLLGALSGGYEAFAYDVSADGSVVVGMALIKIGNGYNWHAFRWENGTMQDLGTLGGGRSRANAVSADGKVVVGAAQDTSGNWHAFRWENGVMEDLGTLGSWSEALDVSANGSVIVGNAEQGAFRWTTQAGMENLSDIYWYSRPTTAEGISPDGRFIVGRGYNPITQNPYEAYLLDTGHNLVMNSTADRPDQNPGDGECSTGRMITRPDGKQEPECTLRAGIQEANASQGADNITFEIPTNDSGYNPSLGVWTITPDSTLPPITEQVTLDAYTQPGAKPNTIAASDTSKGSLDVVLKVVLNGQNARTSGLQLQNHYGSMVRGLVISGFPGDGILITGGSEHRIVGNFIGINPTGQTRVPNQKNGIRIVGSSGNYVGGPNVSDRNLISGNGVMNRGGGILIDSASTNNVVMHNLIGTDRTGTISLFNSAYGVALMGDGTIDNLIENNLISGNRDPGFSSTSCAGTGVQIANGAGGNGVMNNFIGTDALGKVALLNNEGICVTSSGTDNWIQGNLISGNMGNGIWISGESSANRESRSTQISNNKIGVARNAEQATLGLKPIPALGNGSDGIKNGSPGTRVKNNLIVMNGRHGIFGGGEIENVDIIGNVIAANAEWGIYLRGHKSGLIQENGIGELTPQQSNWRDQGGVIIYPDSGDRNRLVRLSNGEGAIHLEGSRKFTIGGADYLTQANNIFNAQNGKNAVEFIDDVGTGADSNRVENNVIHGVGKGARGIYILNSSGNFIYRNYIIDFTKSGVAIKELNGRRARHNQITETKFDFIGFFGFLEPPKAIDLEDNQKPEKNDQARWGYLADQDTGANLKQNTPEAYAYIDWNGDLVVFYKVDSDSRTVVYPLTVEVFKQANWGKDPTGLFLQALTYPQVLAQQDVRVVLGKAANLDVRAGDLLTLTATDAKGNTSEFAWTWVDSVDIQTGMDFGDAPETGSPQGPVPFGYPTKLTSDGARHGAIFNIRLGNALDVEGDSQPDSFLEGDDAFPMPDDEDGLIFHIPTRFPSVAEPFHQPVPQLYPGKQELTVLNTVSGYVSLWIDFNRDGDWDDPDENILQNVFIPTGPTRPKQFFTVPSAIQTGFTALRVRFTTIDSAAMIVTGAAPDGEVEDHLVELLPLPELPYIDFGDAPDSAEISGYPTLLVNRGYPAAGHVVGELRLGLLVDAEWDGQPDDGNDEDGVSLPGALIPGQPAVIEVEVNGGEGYVNAWLDFNQDKDWEDSTEHIIQDTFLVSGQHRLEFMMPDAAVAGQTYLRVRLSSRDSLPFWGIAPDGEVEDYEVEVRLTTDVQAPEKDFSSYYYLSNNYSNPFSRMTTIHFSLPQREYMTLRVFDVFGREVATLVDGELNAGEHTAVFDAKDLPSGVYFAQFRTGKIVQRIKMVLMK